MQRVTSLPASLFNRGKSAKKSDWKSAIDNDNMDELKNAIDEKDIDTSRTKFEMAVFYSVSKGKLEAVKYLIEKLGALPTMTVWHFDYTPFNGASLLNLAIYKDQLDVLKYLITAPQITKSVHFERNIEILKKYATKNGKNAIAAHLEELYTQVKSGEFIAPKRSIVEPAYSASSLKYSLIDDNGNPTIDPKGQRMGY